MRDSNEQLHPLHENLDTAYLDVAALLRYLEGREFTGFVHIVMDECEADIFLRAGETAAAVVRNVSNAQTQTVALEDLLRRVREPGVLVSVYECSFEEIEARIERAVNGPRATADEDESDEMLRVAGELIAAIERAALVAGGDFDAALHASRLTLAEDFPFLNPFARSFEYSDAQVHLKAQTSERLFISGVCEMLRRTINHVAAVEQRLGVRRDAARELSILVRRRRTKFERYKINARQLERIAGMKLM